MQHDWSTIVKRRFLLALALTSAGLLSGLQAQPAAPTRVEYVSGIPAPSLRKILGTDDRHVFLALQNGQITALDLATGQTAFRLETGDDKTTKPVKDAQAVVASADTIYVLDSSDNRIVMFSPDGQYKGQFGKRSGMAGLSSPQGMALAHGILYVADTGNSRIQMFGDNGVFLQTLPINTVEANRNLDTKTAPWKLEKPVAVGVDGAGNIAVLDAAAGLFSDKSQVKVYAPDGRYLHALPRTGKPVAMQPGALSIYVLDGEHFAVRNYDMAGNAVAMFGSHGSGHGQFKSLSGLALQGDTLLVGDPERQVVHHFRTPPAVIGSFYTALPPSVRWQQSLPLAASRLAWNGKDTLVGIAHNKPGVLLHWRDGSEAATEQALKDIRPTALAFGKNGALWAVEAGKHRLLRLNAAGEADLTVGSAGSRNGQLSAPSDIVAASDGSLYVADTGNGRIQGFMPDGVLFRVIDRSTNGKLKRPVALAIDNRDNLYVLDTGRGSVTAYNAAGEPQAEFGNDKNLPEDRLQNPQGLLATQDELFVLTDERVRVYSPDGRLLRSFSAPGDTAGELAQPVAIAPRDATRFYIAERGQPRVQLFATQYRAKPPEALVAEPAVHGVTLRWEPSPMAYVTQYVVYRATSANGPWVAIARSAEATYADTKLKPDQTFHYRVAAATAEGLEGVSSAPAQAVTLKYTPPSPDQVTTETASNSLRFRLEPPDRPLLKAWRLYRKEGEQFRKLVENSEPDLLVEKLDAGRSYSFWLSAVSVDGVESEKRAVQATTQSDTRAPLDIDVAQLTSIFSNSYKTYEQDGIGAARLTNNTGSTLSDIKISFVLNNFMDFPTEQRIASLAPEASADVMLKAVFNNNILTLTEDSVVQAKIEASYFENGQPKVFFQIKSINIYNKHRLSWDERRRYAAFITPKDPVILGLSRAVAAENGGSKDATQVAAALFDTLGVLGLTYVQDPSNPYQVNVNRVDYVDYIQYPRETLQHRTGDCDDLVALYTSALESLGISTRVLLVPGHMLMMFNTGIEAPTDGYTLNKLYAVHDGMLWVPVEATLLGKPFIKAWESGAALYYQHEGKEGFDLLDIHEAWNTFKPATLPDETWRAAVVGRDSLEKRFPDDLGSVLKMTAQTRTRHYHQALQQNADDADAHLQVGIILARLGDHATARSHFNRIIERQPGHAAALNNLGNLHMMEQQFEEAARLYSVAASTDPKDAEVWINLAQAQKGAKNMTAARQSFEQAKKVNPAVASSYKALSLELGNALTPTGKKGR